MSPNKLSNSSNSWLIGATSAVVAAVMLWQLVVVVPRRHQSRRQDTTRGDGATDKSTSSCRRGEDHGIDDEEVEEDEYELPQHLRYALEKEQRRQAKIPLLAMKKPMYDNIRMLDPQGTLLCTISKKKADWYVKKQLAVWEDGDAETTIQLLFEPSHRSNQSDSCQVKNNENDNDEEDEEEVFFNKSIKKNICVVCGDDKYHMRHYIVPYTCRSLFPNKYKMHMAHDVVILCPDCHLDCKKLATKRMKFMERQSRKDPNTATSHFVDHRLHKVKSCASALLKWRQKLPPDTMFEYESLLRSHFDLSPDQELTTSILESANAIITDIPNPDYIPTSVVVVEHYCRDDAAIEAFVKGWRQHFVETTQPQYLPEGWSVNSSVACLSADRKS